MASTKQLYVAGNHHRESWLAAPEPHLGPAFAAAVRSQTAARLQTSQSCQQSSRQTSSPINIRLRGPEAAIAIDQAMDVLMRAHAASTSDLVLALSCIAAIAASSSNPVSNSFSAALGFGLGTACLVPCFEGGRSVLAPPPPAVLPLLPLLGSVASRDQAGTEAALKRLNRRLARPLSSTEDAHSGGNQGGVCTGSGAGGHRSLQSSRHADSEGGGSSSGGGGGSSADCNSTAGGVATSHRGLGLPGAGVLSSCSDADCGSYQSWRSAVTCASSRSGVSSLIAARQAEAQMLNEREGCRAAAARLSGRSAQLYSQRPAAATVAMVAGAVEAEAEAVRGACVAALAAAAADVRCHQTLLGSAALDALPQLLRGSGTSSYAVVLVHNLAAPPSASFRDQLRRRGVLSPLLEHLARLAASDASPARGLQLHDGPGTPPPPGPDLHSLTVALTALACLSAGQDGGEALQQPHLRAHKRLLAVRARVEQWTIYNGSTGHTDCSTDADLAEQQVQPQQGQGLQGYREGQQEAFSPGLRPGQQQDRSQVRVALAKLDALLRRLLRVVGVPVERGGPVGEAAARTSERAPVSPHPPGGGEATCGIAAGRHTLESPALIAEGRTGCGGGVMQQEPAAAPVGGDGTSMSFQSQVMVDGRPLQLTSVITRTSARRPDGTLDVRYHFQDQVSPAPGAKAPQDGSRTLMGTPTTPEGPPAVSPAPCYRSSSTWVHAGVAAAPPATPDDRQLHDQDPDRALREEMGLLNEPRVQQAHDTASGGSVKLASPSGSTPSLTFMTPTWAPRGMDSCGTSAVSPLCSPLPAQSPLAVLAEHADRYLSTASARRRQKGTSGNTASGNEGSRKP